MTTPPSVAVIGAGIGGLSVALALGKLGVDTHVYEQSARFEEVGAGIGLGPNAVKRLDQWGLGHALRQQAVAPDELRVRDAEDGHTLGRLPMGRAFVSRYGAEYLTLHRADLHRLLLEAVQQQGEVVWHVNHRLRALTQTPTQVALHFEHDANTRPFSAAIGADGLHSRVRESVCGPQAARATGHWAYRTLLPMSALPASWRAAQMGLWLGPRWHLVHYPVRGGEWLNLVVLVETTDPASVAGWDLVRTPDQIHFDLSNVLQTRSQALKELFASVTHWRAWCLFDRPVVNATQALCQGRVVLSGDAAHPMLPYLAQGAGMAIEDAECLAQVWQRSDLAVDQRWLAYAQLRWRRVARVQQRAHRNGQVFHATGVTRLVRNTAMALGGARLMDMPWLYGG